MIYNIAFGGKPMQGFLQAVLDNSASEGVTIKAAVLMHGPGCYNFGYELDGENEAFANALAMALMPAKWSSMERDSAIVPGMFVDYVNGFSLLDGKQYFLHSDKMRDDPDYKRRAGL